MIVRMVGVVGIILLLIVAVCSMVDTLIYAVNTAHKEDKVNNRLLVKIWIAVVSFAVFLGCSFIFYIQRNDAYEEVNKLKMQIEQAEVEVEQKSYDYITQGYSHYIYQDKTGATHTIFMSVDNGIYYYEVITNDRIDAWDDYILQMDDNDTPDFLKDDIVVGYYRLYEYNGVTPPSTHYNDGYGNNFDEYRVEYVSALD